MNIKIFSKQSLFHNILLAILICCFIVSIVFFSIGCLNINHKVKNYDLVGTYNYELQNEDEDFEDYSIIPLQYKCSEYDSVLTIQIPFENFENGEYEETIIGYLYDVDGNYISLANEATETSINAAYKEYSAENYFSFFGVFIVFFIISLALFVVVFKWNSFSLYEKIWFVSIIVLASVISLIFPEESANGVNGIWIMLLYLLDTFLNILCELLISKQSKWNFIVSVFVELTEILICVVLAYRFATMVTTLFFWLPIDIISFINWNKHPDKDNEEITNVRKIKGWLEVVIIASIVIWTVGVGYLLTTLDLGGDFIKNKTIETIICYVDACASAVGIVNGIFIFLRLREQWIAWYISAILEAIINILSGQFVLLVLKFGYLTNTTYGYIKWTKYINSQKSLRDTNA